MSCYLFIRKRASVIRLEIQLFGDRQEIQQTSLNMGKYERKNCDSVRRKFREAIKRVRNDWSFEKSIYFSSSCVKIENDRHCSGRFSQNPVMYVRRSSMTIYESSMSRCVSWANVSLTKSET